MTRERFTLLVKDSQAGLRRFLTALCCGDGALADDLAQEAYLRAFIAVDTAGDVGNFNGWIRRIAYNCFVSHVRSRKTNEPIEQAAHMQAVSSPDETFRYQALYRALSLLTEKERTAVVMYYLEDSPTPEIAATLETSEGNVRQILSRGRSHLKNLLS